MFGLKSLRRSRVDVGTMHRRRLRRTHALRFESLENRRMPSGSTATLSAHIQVNSTSAMPAVMAAANSVKTNTQAADRLFTVNVQLGGGVLSQIMNLSSEINNMSSAVDSVLGEVPGWHLQADFDDAPQFSGHVTGTVDEAANGTLKTASLSITVSGDFSATIEGYYGISILHIGVGVTANLSGIYTASATYSTSRGWTFAGSGNLSGSLTGFAEETALAWEGELYVQGSVTGSMAINNSGIASGGIVLAGSVGAAVEQYNLLRRSWVPYSGASYSLGQRQLGSFVINVVPFFQDALNIGAYGSGVIV